MIKLSFLDCPSYKTNSLYFKELQDEYVNMTDARATTIFKQI